MTYQGSTFGKASQWIFEQLSQGPKSAAVLALVPLNAMYPGIATSGTGYPRVTWNSASPSVPITSSDARKTAERHRFQIHSWDHSEAPEGADAVANVVDKAIDRQDSALLTGGWWVTAWQVPRGGQISLPALTDGEVYQHLITDYYLMIYPYP